MRSAGRDSVKTKGITQEEIARKAGVSRSIVSRVLSNAPHSNISPSTRSKVLEIARQLNYKPRTTVQRHHNIVVGLYDLAYMNRHHFSTIISGIAHQSGAFDFDMQFLSMNEEVRTKAPNLYFLDRPTRRNVKGYIIIDQAVPDRKILKIRRFNIPFVLINREMPGEDVPCVLADETKSTYDLTTYLINKKYVSFSLLPTSRQFDRDARKIIGFKNALEEHGLHFDEGMIHETRGQNAIERVNMIMRILNSEERPMAIMTVDDLVAVHVIELAQRMGLRIPADLAVTGYNDMSIASLYPISITSVRPPLRDLGKQAIILLETLIAGRKPENPRIVLDCQICIRRSA